MPMLIDRELLRTLKVDLQNACLKAAQIHST